MSTAAAARQQERQNRNELFDGPPEADQADPLDALDNHGLVNKCVATHKDTTHTAQRALAVVEDAKNLQADTLAALDAQGQRMVKIDKQMYEINEEITYAEKLLSYMRRCCCCFFCDSCTGADPEEKKKKKWKKRVDRGETEKGGLQVHQPEAVVNGNGAGASTSASGSKEVTPSKYRDPDIRLPDEHRSAEMELHAETRKQNETMDQIAQGLEHLLQGAKVMNEEMDRQNKTVDGLDSRTHNTRNRILDMNKNTQLRSMGNAQANSKQQSIIPSKGSLAMSAAKKASGF